MKTIIINRSVPLTINDLVDKVPFVTKDWRIRDQNANSLKFDHLDIDSVCFSRRWENPLDAQAFLAFWDNKDSLPDCWKVEPWTRLGASRWGGVIPKKMARMIVFGGTIIVSQEGRGYLIHMYWDGKNGWVSNPLDLISLHSDGGKTWAPTFQLAA